MKRSVLKKKIEEAKAGYAASFWNNYWLEIILDEVMREDGFEPEPVDELAVKLSERVRPNSEVDQWVYDAIVKQEIAYDKRIKEQAETIENLHHQLNAGYQAYIEDTARRDAKIKEQAETIEKLGFEKRGCEQTISQLDKEIEERDTKIRELEARLNAPEPEELVKADKAWHRFHKYNCAAKEAEDYIEQLLGYIELLKGRK